MYVDRLSPDFEYHGLPTDFWSNLETSVHLAVLTSTGGNTWKADNGRGKAFVTAWTLFCLIMVACYTAELASFLSKPARRFGGGGTFQSFASKQQTACVRKDSDYARYLATHLDYKFIRQLPCASELEMLQAVRDESCEGIIAPQPTVDLLCTGDDFCDGDLAELNMVVADLLDAGPLSMGIALSKQAVDFDEVSTMLSYWTARFVSTGRVAGIYDVLHDAGGCGGGGGGAIAAGGELVASAPGTSALGGGDDDEDKPPDGLAVSDTGGLFVLMGFVGFLALVHSHRASKHEHRLARWHGTLTDFIM